MNGRPQIARRRLARRRELGFHSPVGAEVYIVTVQDVSCRVELCKGKILYKSNNTAIMSQGKVYTVRDNNKTQCSTV